MKHTGQVFLEYVFHIYDIVEQETGEHYYPFENYLLRNRDSKGFKLFESPKMRKYLWLAETQSHKKTRIVEQETGMPMTILISTDIGLKEEEFGRYNDEILVEFYD